MFLQQRYVCTRPMVSCRDGFHLSLPLEASILIMAQYIRSNLDRTMCKNWEGAPSVLLLLVSNFLETIFCFNALQC
jgi:hypothetical protein